MLYTTDSIIPIINKLKASSTKLVLATGFFDLLHSEHINFLQKAKKAGDILVVGVESDARAKKIKGANRPVEPQSLRCQKVGQYADYVIALGDDFDNQVAYENLMSIIRPDIYAVSSHTSHLNNKRELTQKYGGELVIVHDWNPATSTTAILAERQKQL